MQPPHSTEEGLSLGDVNWAAVTSYFVPPPALTEAADHKVISSRVSTVRIKFVRCIINKTYFCSLINFNNENKLNVSHSKWDAVIVESVSYEDLSKKI